MQFFYNFPLVYFYFTASLWTNQLEYIIMLFLWYGLQANKAEFHLQLLTCKQSIVVLLFLVPSRIQLWIQFR
jgi:hypothetical protein